MESDSRSMTSLSYIRAFKDLLVKWAFEKISTFEARNLLTAVSSAEFNRSIA